MFLFKHSNLKKKINTKALIHSWWWTHKRAFFFKLKTYLISTLFQIQFVEYSRLFQSIVVQSWFHKQLQLGWGSRVKGVTWQEPWRRKYLSAGIWGESLQRALVDGLRVSGNTADHIVVVTPWSMQTASGWKMAGRRAKGIDGQVVEQRCSWGGF